MIQKQLDDLAQSLREILERLGRVEASLRKLTEAQPEQEWYTTREAARILKLSTETVRMHCRTGRIVAQRTRSGRGNRPEFRVQQKEIDRLRAEGLLPGNDGPSVDKPR